MWTIKLQNNVYQGIIAANKWNAFLRASERTAITLLDLIFGFLLGAIAGWLIGWRCGAAYKALFEPLILPTFEQVRHWYYMPVTFANWGLYLGGIIGMLIVRLHSQNRLKNHIMTLVERGHTKPGQLAQELNIDKRKIESILTRLSQKQLLPDIDDTNTITISENKERKNTMKNVRTCCLFFLSLFLLTGCLPSLHPLYTKDTIVFDEAILGKWYDNDGGSWSFTKNGENKYDVRVLESDGKEALFEVHLVQLGDHRFIDLYPGDNFDLENTADMYSFNLVPAHTFMKLDLAEPNLLLQWVCLNEIIEDDPNVLQHEELEDGDSILITAKSEDIQQVLIQYLDEVLDGDPAVLRKSLVDFSNVETIFDDQLDGQWESDDGNYVDIISLDNGYDILYSDSERQQSFRGVLYNLNERPILGLYYIADPSGDSVPNMDLAPDVLVMLECDEQQLKTWLIDWDEVEALVSGDPKCSVDLSEPDDVFQRVSE